MIHRGLIPVFLLCLLVIAVLIGSVTVGATLNSQPSTLNSKHRWLFVWRNMSDPAEVDRMIARFPRARTAGYNGVVFSHNIPAEKATELRDAARKYGLDLVAIVMGGGRDRNYVEGVLSKDALFVARGAAAYSASLESTPST